MAYEDQQYGGQGPAYGQPQYAQGQQQYAQPQYAQGQPQYAPQYGQGGYAPQYMPTQGQEMAPAAGTISRRAYNLLTFGIVTASFFIVWVTQTVFNLQAPGLVFSIGAIILSIAGIFVMGAGKKKQSIPMTAIGYVMFTMTFGVSLTFALSYYNVGTVAYAFACTACLSGIFMILGVMFPAFFEKVGRICALALIGVIIVEVIATIFFHADQTIFDYIVIAIFCGILGYDSYKMAADEPTVPNAIWHAADIYADMVNILLRILDIVGNRN